MRHNMFRPILVCAFSALILSAQTPQALTPSATGVSEPLSTLAKQNPTAPQVLVFDNDVEVPNQLYLPRAKSKKTSQLPANTVVGTASPMINQTVSNTLPVTVMNSFTGLGTGFNGTWTVEGLLPPDTTLAVGPTQIVQWVNIKLTILDKTSGAPALGGPGFVNANQIWAGLGGSSVCAAQNQGDPILQYDRLAGRWVLMQFAFTYANATNTAHTAYPAAPFALCWAVSQTSDATGIYNLYQYSMPNLPDYPKLGVWPDAYYVTDNSYAFSSTTGSGTYVGTRYCAFDRAAMIAGTTAGSVCFSGLDAAGGTHFATLPADFEGTTLPPANETEFFINGDWFSKNTPPYTLQLRRFHPDFVTPVNSTLTDGFGGAFDSYVSLPFDSSVLGACGDVGGQCVPQPGTTRKLDTLSMRPMYRLAYRNLGSNREVLVFTESVDPPGAAVAGIQLIEIRNPAANPPSIYNNVALNPDSTNRWMGAAATDKLGNVAFGYSVGSSLLPPGIRIAGRLRNDLPGTVRGETNVQSGSGSQTSSAQRWGDYSTMQIDPSDNCTFWFTTEYIVNTASADWATKIFSFKFNNCQ
jgi:hypothetical protein